MTIKEQVDSFHRFATSQIENGGADLSMDEIYSLWRARNPTDAELAESVAAVKAAYADLLAGDEGVLADDVIRESRERLGLVLDE